MATINALNTTLSGQTGTVSFVGGTSPTLTTPVIQVIVDSGFNTQLSMPPNASAVNYVDISNSIATNLLDMKVVGSDSDINLTCSGSGNQGASPEGCSTNSNATAGYYGEFLSSVIGSGSPVTLTTNVVADITSVTFGAGDYDIFCSAAFVTAAGTSVSEIRAGTSLTTAALGSVATVSVSMTIRRMAVFIPGVSTMVLQINQGRFSFSGSTTVYLCARGTFTLDTLKTYGALRARRVR